MQHLGKCIARYRERNRECEKCYGTENLLAAAYERERDWTKRIDMKNDIIKLRLIKPIFYRKYVVMSSKYLNFDMQTGA